VLGRESGTLSGSETLSTFEDDQLILANLENTCKTLRCPVVFVDCWWCCWWSEGSIIWCTWYGNEGDHWESYDAFLGWRWQHQDG